MNDLSELRAEVEELRNEAAEGFVRANTTPDHIGFAVAMSAFNRALDLIDKHTREGQ